MKNILLICLSYLATACSGSFTGPVTKTEYKVEVGCTSDMKHYKEEREQVLKDQDTDRRHIDCPVDEQTDHSY